MDLLVFRDLAAQAAAARAAGDDGAAAERYSHAMGLWRGEPLADVDVLSGHPGITALRQELAGVLLRYAEVACALGQYDRVLPRLQALADAEPLNEPAHARLMIALAGSGQQAAAIRVYEDMRARLDRELGLFRRRARRGLRASAAAGHPRREPGAGAYSLPGSPGGLGLVTSRNRLTGLAAAEGARLITHGLLTEAESQPAGYSPGTGYHRVSGGQPRGAAPRACAPGGRPARRGPRRYAIGWCLTQLGGGRAPRARPPCGRHSATAVSR